MLPIGPRSPPRHEQSPEAVIEGRNHPQTILFPGVPAVGTLKHHSVHVKAEDVWLEVAEDVLPPLGFAVQRREIEEFIYLLSTGYHHVLLYVFYSST